MRWPSVPQPGCARRDPISRDAYGTCMLGLLRLGRGTSEQARARLLRCCPLPASFILICFNAVISVQRFPGASRMSVFRSRPACTMPRWRHQRRLRIQCIAAACIRCIPASLNPSLSISRLRIIDFVSSYPLDRVLEPHLYPCIARVEQSSPNEVLAVCEPHSVIPIFQTRRLPQRFD